MDDSIVSIGKVQSSDGVFDVTSATLNAHITQVKTNIKYINF